MSISLANLSSGPYSFSLRFHTSVATCSSFSSSVSNACFPLCGSGKVTCTLRRLACCADSSEYGSNPDKNPKEGAKRKTRVGKTRVPKSEVDNLDKKFPPLIPKKPRRGRKSEAAAVEDFVRNRLEQTFESIRKENPDVLKNMENIMKKKANRNIDSESEDSSDDDDDDEDEAEKEMVVEEEDPNWPLDADVGWGIRASEYFEKHSIKNTVGEDGREIDWEGEIDEGLVKEITCLDWESFAFHPSPLVVLVFERYNKASDNWKVLKELEKAAKVYWAAKDRLPPRTVKIDMNIEKDLAYALKVKECPQVLFLRGNKILYREKESRSADELVQMIAHFYYNAKRPSCVKDEATDSSRSR